MNDSPSEIELLRAELAELRKEVAVIQTRTTVATPSNEFVKHDTDATDEPEANRRGFLRLAGAAAVGATAAAVISQSSPAAATIATQGLNTGDAVSLGLINQAAFADVTVIQNPSGTNLMPLTFRANNWSSPGSSLTLPTDQRIALAGTTSGSDGTSGKRTGVYGRTADPGSAGGQGVFGSAEGVENVFLGGFQFGVFGSAGTNGGFGVMGYNPTGTSSVGVLGRADEGTGVIASSFTGISLYVRNSGRILQDLRTTAGAPTTGTFTKGEMIRDLSADMYICTVSGTPGTWKRVATTDQLPVVPAPQVNFLAKPIRLLDSRGGAPIANGGVKFTGATPLTMQITGTAVDGISVPAGAKGILGNLTSSLAEQPGFARVWAADQATPATSNINFVTNVDVANYFIASLSPTGQMKIEASQRTHLILDVSGYLI